MAKNKDNRASDDISEDGAVDGQVEQLQNDNAALLDENTQLGDANDELGEQVKNLEDHLETLKAEAEAEAEAEPEAKAPKKNRLTKEIAPAEEGEIVIAESDPYFAGVARSVKQVKGGERLIKDGCIRVMETDQFAMVVVDSYLMRSGGDPAHYGPMKEIRDRLKK